MTNFKRINTSLVTKAGSVVIAALATVSQVHAQTINTNQIVGDSTLGSSISTLPMLMNFFINLLRYLGWIGVILGVAFAIFVLIYKLFFAPDSEEAMKNVQSQLTKAVLIVIAGILLISFGYIIQVVASFFGVTAVINTNAPSVNF